MTLLYTVYRKSGSSFEEAITRQIGTFSWRLILVAQFLHSVDRQSAFHTSRIRFVFLLLGLFNFFFST